MRKIKLHNLYFKPFIAEQEVRSIVKKIADDIKSDIAQEEVPLFIGILNGAFLFTADLMREFKGNCEISFIKLTSYDGIASTKEVKKSIGINQKLEGRTVIILEDIVETGQTLQEIYKILKNEKVKELKIATLFLKSTVFKKELPIHYVGRVIDSKFIVGYGLDYNGLGRNYNAIYQLTSKEMKNIVLFGPPGAGKGTQAEILKDQYNLVHISTGVLFRTHIKNKTPLGLLAKKYIDNGDLVPDAVTIDMLKEEIDKNPRANGFIFDGFPRTQSQAAALADFLTEKDTQINGMIALEVPEDLLVARLLERGKTSGRADDTDEHKIRHRFEEYHNKTAILKQYYQSQNNYFGIDGVGSVKEVTARLSAIFDKL